jgi:hypothetical protein
VGNDKDLTKDLTKDVTKKTLNHMIGDGLIEPTLPDKPTSKNQMYRTSGKGE